MKRWKVITQATVERIYYVEAEDEKEAEAVSVNTTSEIETDIDEETSSITVEERQ